MKKKGIKIALANLIIECNINIYMYILQALSNQKYGEFQSKFQDVGLMTDDVTINENASCIVMTTEVCVLFFFLQLTSY